jgi:hypothetical protein
MKINKSYLRKNIIDVMLNENHNSLVREKTRLNGLLANKEKYIYGNSINEGMIDSLGDVGGSLLKTLGGDIDSIKSYFISGMLENLGVTNEKTKDIITNILEQVGMDDLMGIMTGTFGCDELTEDIVKGLVEYAIEDGIESIVEFIDELDIPVIDSMIGQFAGGEGLMSNVAQEQLVNSITNAVYPIIGDKIEGFVCNLGFLGMGGDAEGYPPDEEAEDEEELVNEIFNHNIFESTKRINVLNRKRRKLMILKKNE